MQRSAKTCSHSKTETVAHGALLRTNGTAFLVSIQNEPKLPKFCQTGVAFKIFAKFLNEKKLIVVEENKVDNLTLLQYLRHVIKSEGL